MHAKVAAHNELLLDVGEFDELDGKTGVHVAQSSLPDLLGFQLGVGQGEELNIAALKSGETNSRIYFKIKQRPIGITGFFKQSQESCRDYLD